MAILDLNYNQPVNNAGTVDVGRGLTPAVFNGIDIGQRNPGRGWFFFDDFIQTAPVATGTAAAPTGLGSWTSTQVGAVGTAIGTGAFNTAATDNGWIRMANGSATPGNGITLNQLGAAITPVNGMTVGFEVRFRFSNVALSTTGPQWALGLVGNTVGSAPISSADINASLAQGLLFHGNGATNNTIRFHSRNGTGAGARTVLTNLLGTQGGTDVTITTDGVVTYKLGFRWVVGRSCDVFVNGLKYTAYVPAAPSGAQGTGPDPSRCPNAVVGLAMVSQSGGVDRFMEVDWIALGVA